ncbi:hypothetical protein I6N95_26775 [Vagococcus sp. BWB3-3]|uniref:Uncharacterized protein n=1 Tax=Vagococcus allomyrinae TaxID=2794353 RepID=A0A940PGU2_9ENTE|nr:hypothetical protein [Vagococcus allomyrinae]MBP1044620.1 hypothetical protein [Vagococcus allomyrinae]
MAKNMAHISCDEYEKLKQSLGGLGWLWQSYQRERPNDWYEFKYQTVLRNFLANDVEGQLTSQAHYKRFPKRVKLPERAYREMKELSEIYEELQDVLEHPPYGTKSLSELLR